MKGHFNEVTLSQISKRLEELRNIKDKASVRGGWIRYMRTALGLTLNELSQRVGIAAPTLAQSEKREAEGKVSISTLKKIAEAMDCELVYSFVPKKEFKSLILDKAREKARNSLKKADLHMKLENQKADGDMEERIERLARKLIEQGDIW